MNPELDSKLCEKYPLIFADRSGDISKTCMCWGFSCGDGWYNIIDMMCYLIQNHIKFSHTQAEWDKRWNDRVNDESLKWEASVPRKERPVREPITQVVASQVKEKFGGLRFYYSGGDDYISGIVAMAEEISLRTCEICGDAGKSRNTGWIKTRCEKHA